MQAVFETIFHVVYLSTVIFLGIKMIIGSKGKRQYLLYGVMAVTLGFGVFQFFCHTVYLLTMSYD
jgi:hypothetical protein